MSVKWTKELLEECRNERGVVFGMMSKEAQEALYWYPREILLNSGWVKDTGNMPRNFAYRLRPDWTPPELEDKPYVDVLVVRDSDYFFKFNRDGAVFDLSDAIDFYDFAGFVYADGFVTVSARRDHFDGGIAIVPVAVRFWKEAAI